MARPHNRLLVLASLAALFLCVATAPSAGAATRTVRATTISGGKLVFKLRGVRPASIRAARLRVGAARRRVPLAPVKRAARRGTLRLSPPRTGGGRLRRRAKLVIVTKRTPALASTKPCPAVPAGALHLSQDGSDSAQGDARHPWRTLEKAAASAGPGASVVLHGGAYGQSGRATTLARSGTAAAPITFLGAPGEAAVVRGGLFVDGDHLRACNLKLVGATGPVAPRTAENPEGEEVKVSITGDDFELANSEVSGSRWHAGVYLSGAENARLLGNYIHDNGRFEDSSHANLDHGVYWGSGSGLVEGNRIEHNFAHAVVLYPNADGVTVRRNTMTRHGRAAVMFGEGARDNVVERNQIHGNRKGVQAYELTGTGNQVRNNRVWNNAEGNLTDLGGLRTVANVTS